MKLFRLNRYKSIRSRLMMTLLSILLPICIIGGMALNSFIKTNIEHSIEQQLNTTTNSILNMVRASITLSIKNRLRAIAEKNRDILEGIWNSHGAGKYAREEAIALMKEILGTQRIGKSGYIYCVNTIGTSVYHPQKKVEGANWGHRHFIQKMIQRKKRIS